MSSLVKELHFSVVVFDTAPTGHTLRFLAMPTLFQKGLGKMSQLKSQFGPLFSSVSQPVTLYSVMAVCVTQLLPAMGVGDEALRSQMMESMPIVEQINQEFRDPVKLSLSLSLSHPLLIWPQEKSTFVCVCIAEFLSLYETERLVQELLKLGIDVHNVVVNQLLQPERDQEGGERVTVVAIAWTRVSV